MNAKEAAKQTKAVNARQRRAELAKADRELQAERKSAKAQLPKELERVFADIRKTASTGNNFVRATIYYNASLASMLSNKLKEAGYKVTTFSDGGYDYDGGYIGETTEWDLHISW